MNVQCVRQREQWETAQIREREGGGGNTTHYGSAYSTYIIGMGQITELS